MQGPTPRVLAFSSKRNEPTMTHENKSCVYGAVTLRLARACPLLAALACGASKPAEPAPNTVTNGTSGTSGTETPAPSSEGCEPREAAPTTAEECTCAGGVVHGDIGDGKIACSPDEVELGRIQQGIEGAVCCRPAAAVL